MRGGAWLFIATVLFIASLLFHQVPLLLVSLLFFLTGGAVRLWNRYCLARVEYHRHLSANRVFFGEMIQMEIEVINRKMLPLPWLQIDDEIPEDLIFLKGKTNPSHLPERATLSNLLSLWWYHKINRRYAFQCVKRGFFNFGPARLRSGDPFGFFQQETEFTNPDYLMVYPRILPLEKLGIPSKQLSGDIRTRHVFEDPILTAGVRDYHFGDSLKYIHWKTSARTGKLQTKVFEPTTSVDVSIFLNVRTTPPTSWGFAPELLELTIITAASIANTVLEQGCRVGLYVNQTRRASADPVRIPPSQHPDQLKQILEALAQLHSMEALPIEKVVQRESSSLPWVSTMLIIAAFPSESLLATLVRMRRAGRAVTLVQVGGEALAFSTYGINTYHVRGDVKWRDLTNVILKHH